MKSLIFLILPLLTGCACRAERVLIVGFDLSGTAWRGGNNPYDAGWVQALKTVQGGDHVYAAIINERGLLNGEPVIDFTIRPYSLLSDKRTDYDAAVQAKLEKQRQALDRLLKDTAPAKGTEIIGFLHAAAQILGAYPARTIRQVIVWTDSLQEGDEVNLAALPLTADQIAAIIEGERQAGRLPRLSGMSIWFVTGPSVQSAHFASSKLLRLEAFWRKYIQTCGGDLRAFSPVLVNFGADRQ